MKAILDPIGTEVEWSNDSAVTEIVNTHSGLRIVLAAPVEVDRYVEIHFPHVHAFQVMDEGDMLEYWMPPLPERFIAYKVISGGWRERVDGHLLNVTSALDHMQEWLIVSADLCITCLC